MKFFEPSEKRTTVAVYVFLVGVFALLCILIGANIGAIWGLLGAFLEIIRPFIYGFVIAFALHQPVHFVERALFGKTKMKRKLKHALSVVIVYVLVLLILMFMAIAVIPEIVNNFDDFRIKVDEFVSNFKNKTAEMLSSTNNDSVNVHFDIDPTLRKNPSDRLFSFTLRNYSGIGIKVQDNSIRREVKELFDKAVTAIGEILNQSLPGVFSSAVTVLLETKNIVIGVMISLYFLLGENKIKQYISHMGNVWLPKKVYKVFVWLLDKSKNIFRDYIMVRFLDGLIIGALMLICLLVFRTPFAVLLALIMGVASLFPFIGAIVGIALGSLIMLIIDVRYMLVFMVVAILLTILDSRYIEPMLNLGRDKHKLAAIWVYAGIIIMGGLFGIIGVLIGIPLFAFIYSIIKELLEKRLIAKGLETETTEWYLSKTVEHDETEEIPDVEEGTDMETFFEERDDNEAYKNMKIRLRYIFRKMKPFMLKLKSVLEKIWLKIRPVVMAVFKALKVIWRGMTVPFIKLRGLFKKKNKKR
ncbi:MAG: AI-2E family transporter [Ruminococcaceae bacterium]|nr:AI-2E family transporter [Oscillospiraceae bacterium]